MPINHASSNDGPASWRALLNEVFGLERWSIVATYPYPSTAAGAAVMPKLYVVAVPKKVCHLVVQEWPNGNFTYFLETKHFDATECRQQLAMWRDNLI